MVITGKTETWDLSLSKVARRIREIGDGVHETLPGKRVHQFEGTDTPTMPHVATVDRGTVNTQQALDEFLLERRLSNRAPATLEQDSWAVRPSITVLSRTAGHPAAGGTGDRGARTFRREPLRYLAVREQVPQVGGKS